MMKMFSRAPAILALCSTLGFAAESADKPWSAQDSIGVRYFVANPGSGGPPGWIAQPQSQDQPVVFAPDGRHFFYVFFHGDLATDQMVYELQVHSVETVRQALAQGAKGEPAPMHRIRMASSRADELESAAIYRPYWESPSTIVFSGAEGGGGHRIYRFDLQSGALRSVTDARHDVLADPAVTFTLQGETAIFPSRSSEPWTPLETYPMAVIRGNDLWQTMEAHRPVWDLYVTYQGRPARHLISHAWNTGHFGPKISPDGRWAILILPPKGWPIPARWNDYQVPPESGYRFVLADLRSGVVKPVFDAPSGTVTQAGRDRAKPFDAFWSADSRHVLLYNTALPLDLNETERRRMSYIVDFAPHTGRWTVVAPMADDGAGRVTDSIWANEGRTLLLTRQSPTGQPIESIVCEYHDGRWTTRVGQARDQPAVSAPAVLPPGFSVSLDQGINSPPRIVAKEGSRELTLTQPDPTLEGIDRAPVERVVWREPNGESVSGLLMLPRDHEKLKPLPLVIQGYSLDTDAFRPDGAVLSGFAAQPLVSEGFAVLQVPLAYDDRESTYMTPEEGKARVDRIDAAVDSLASRGLVDPSRVGLIGFSRGGYSVYYILTHPGRIRPAAAIVFDSITAGYGEYVNGMAIGDASQIYEKQYGSGSFWENKAGWMDAPAFNLDRLTAPVLFSTTGKTTRWAMLETVGAFRAARRPFEYLYFSDGAHQLQKPRQRQAALQATIDWMNFWLVGNESRISRDDDRLTRWQTLRTQWKATQAESAAARTSQAR